MAYLNGWIGNRDIFALRFYMLYVILQNEFKTDSNLYYA